MQKFFRRGVLAAAAGGAAFSAATVHGQNTAATRGNDGADIVGPTNKAREAQDPFTVAPPRTDHGTLPNMKWSFADSHMRLEEGGWA
jgi:oxalate decarboxylase